MDPVTATSPLSPPIVGFTTNIFPLVRTFRTGVDADCGTLNCWIPLRSLYNGSFVFITIYLISITFTLAQSLGLLTSYSDVM